MQDKSYYASLIITVSVIILTAIGIFWVFSFTDGDKYIQSDENSFSYLALGDSYTIGEAVDPAESWPNLLANQLSTEGIRITPPKIIATTGWRTDNLMAGIHSESITQKYDLVSLLIGVNNEFQGESIEGFETKFTTCLTAAVEHAKNGAENVFVLSIPDYGYTPYGKRRKAAIGKRIDAYNAICKSVSEEHGVLFLDITPISRNGLKNKALVARDDLHPSGAQYALWVDHIKNKVRSLVLK